MHHAPVHVVVPLLIVTPRAGSRRHRQVAVATAAPGRPTLRRDGLASRVRQPAPIAGFRTPFIGWMAGAGAGPGT